MRCPNNDLQLPYWSCQLAVGVGMYPKDGWIVTGTSFRQKTCFLPGIHKTRRVMQNTSASTPDLRRRLRKAGDCISLQGSSQRGMTTETAGLLGRPSV